MHQIQNQSINSLVSFCFNKEVELHGREVYLLCSWHGHVPTPSFLLLRERERERERLVGACGMLSSLAFFSNSHTLAAANHLLHLLYPFFLSPSLLFPSSFFTYSYKHLYVGDLNILLVVFQAAVTVVAVSSCKAAGLVEYPPVTVSVLRGWSGVNIFFCLMLFTGMASLQYNSVPMVSVFKVRLLRVLRSCVFIGVRHCCCCYL